MDFSEDRIKEEVSNFVSSLQKLLPKKKDLIVIEPVREKLTKLSNIHAEAKSVFPVCFTGARLVILREILDKVKIVQQYNYGRPKDPHKCYAQLLHKELDTKRVDDGLLLDSTGSATATYTDTIDGTYEMRLTSKIRDLISSETEILFERENNKSIGSILFAVKDMEPNSMKVVTQWMYKMVPEFSFGTELSFKPLAYPQLPELSISGRYERSSFTLSTTVSKSGFQMCVYKQFAKDLRVSTIVNEAIKGGPATVGLALHKSYSNGSELKIFVDSQRCGGFTFQKDVVFHEAHSDARVLRVIGSTLIDKQRRVRFGFGFNLDF